MDTRRGPGGLSLRSRCSRNSGGTGATPAKTWLKTGNFVSCDPKPEILVFSSPEELAEAVAKEFQKAAAAADGSGKIFSVALSGGTTPKLLFDRLASPEIAETIPWEAAHLFWGDERCVPPGHPESNYGMTRQALLGKIAIPEENIHRIHGEAEPEKEIQRYSEEIRETLGTEGVPRFDWIILGLGADGHTASLFPGGVIKEDSRGVCGATEHPDTGQTRITLTLKTINEAARVLFLAAGSSKAEMAGRILRRPLQDHKEYPAGLVNPGRGRLEWYLDREAAALIDNN